MTRMQFPSGIEVEVLRYPQAEEMLMSFSGSFSLRAYLTWGDSVLCPQLEYAHARSTRAEER